MFNRRNDTWSDRSQWDADKNIFPGLGSSARVIDMFGAIQPKGILSQTNREEISFPGLEQPRTIQEILGADQSTFGDRLLAALSAPRRASEAITYRSPESQGREL